MIVILIIPFEFMMFLFSAIWLNYKYSSLFRKCENCQRMFATANGLQCHLTRNKNKACGLLASTAKKRKFRAFLVQQNSKIRNEDLSELGSSIELPTLKKRRSRGEILTRQDKLHILRVFNFFHADNDEKRSKVRCLLCLSS